MIRDKKSRNKFIMKTKNSSRSQTALRDSVRQPDRSFSRRDLRPSFDQLPAFAEASAGKPPREGWAERRQAPGACEAPGPAMTLQAEALARRPTSPCDRGRAPLGAPSLAIFGLGVRVSAF